VTDTAVTVRYGIDYFAMTPAQAKVILDSLTPRGTFVARYGPTYQGDPKGITHDEASALSADGFDIVVVGESVANRALDGYAAGVADARAWFPLAWAAGMPKGRPINAAVDFDDTADPNEIKPYFQGWSTECISLNGGHKGSRGAYGGLATVTALFGWDLIDFAIQTSAWSSEGHPLKWNARAQLRQIAYRNGYDEDEAVAADFGQWSLRKPTPPKPKPPKYPTLTAAQKAQGDTFVKEWPTIRDHPGALPKQLNDEAAVFEQRLGEWKLVKP
jgi:hypothetical protein